MNHILEKYFAFVLAGLGYPTDEIRWSLGYCQGDGMRFSGMVDMRIVARRLLADKPMWLAEALSATGKGETIAIRATDHRYCHWNTMAAERSNDVDLTHAEDVAMTLLLELVTDDKASVAQRLESEGCTIIESTPYESERVITREFEDFMVAVDMKPEDDASRPESGDVIYDSMDLVGYGKGRTAIVVIEVTIEHEGQEVASQALQDVEFRGRPRDVPREPYFRSTVRELLSEACEEAREALRMEKVRAQPLQLAA